MENPPLVKNLAYDSLLADTKLIAEAWDAGGLIRSEVFRHSADGQNGTEDTGMTCGNI